VLLAFLYGSSGKKFRDIPDRELIDRFRMERDPLLIGVLFDRYVHLVYGVCLRYLPSSTEAEDAAMEIFESLFSLLQQHRVEKFPPWIHSVARNHCLMKLRRKKARGTFRDMEYTESATGFMENEGEWHPMDEEKTSPDIMKAMERLKGAQQQCLRLFYFERKSYREVALMTGMELKKVKSHIQNGKRNLKLILERDHEES